MFDEPLPLGARVLTAGAVALPDGIVVEGWLAIDGERIIAVGSGAPPDRPSWSLPGLVVPGFVDAHVHGGGGAHFDDGAPEAAGRVAQTHLARGSTTVMATLGVERVEALEAACEALATLADAGVVGGIHLEGPWLSPNRVVPERRGKLALPELGAVDRLVEAARGHLRMVTIAPELPGALDVISALTASGVVVAIGHTDATYDQTRAALDAGATAGTHLFHAMPPLDHRAPGPIAALWESAAYLELVAEDLHPSVLSLAWRDDRTALVTTTTTDSARTMASSLQFATSHAGIPLPEALAAVTSTPAAMLGLAEVGRLVPGAWADLVELSEELEVTRVMRRGVWVSRP